MTSEPTFPLRPEAPVATVPVTLPGPAGSLEAAVDFPDGDIPAIAVTAIVCHPLPTDGGTMHNKVVTMLSRALRDLGVTVARFNFRGAGASAGAFDSGRGEREDLRAVATWVRHQRPHDRLWLAGFSFGAYVSICMADALQPEVLISVAPSVGVRDFGPLMQAPSMPWLVVQGEADDIIDPRAVHAWLDDLRPPQLERIRMPDTSHFFHRKLIDLRGAVRHWAKARLPR